MTMTRTHYDAELAALRDETYAIGELVAARLAVAVAQLEDRDLPAAEALVAADADINARCHGLERAALVTITTEGPMASDVRLLAAVLDIANELERIGDYAKGIAVINTTLIGSGFGPGATARLAAMAERAGAMLLAALEAFRQLDAAAAAAVIAQDDGVDALFNEVFGLAMAAGQDSSNGALGGALGEALARANYLVWVAHNLERSADRATNIAQRVVFTVTGDLADLDAHPPAGRPAAA